MEYTERVDGFQIRDVTYWPGYEPAFVAPCYDIVKWEQYEKPQTVADWNTKEEKTVTEYCYSVGVLEWNIHEGAFDFRSVGTRWLEENVTNAALDMIMDFVHKKDAELYDTNEDIRNRQSWIQLSERHQCPSCRDVFSTAYKYCPHCGRRVFTRY